MALEPNYKNNPLHGLSLKDMLSELIAHYGFELMYAYLKIKAFDKKPSLESAIKFLKKTDWAREKTEAFYLYQLKGLPRASAEQFELPPRDRIVSDAEAQRGLENGPAELSLEDAERLHAKRAQKANQRSAKPGSSPRKSDRKPARNTPPKRSSAANPWANSPGFKN